MEYSFNLSISKVSVFILFFVLRTSTLWSQIITTIAGNGYVSSTGNGAYTGDGGLADSASLWNPTGVVVDKTGNVFIADSYNGVVRKVNIDGIIITVAGNGKGYGYNGDGEAATSATMFPNSVAVDKLGNIYISDFNNGRIRKVGTNGIISTIAETYQPLAVAVDSLGNVYFASELNIVYKIDAKGDTSTIAGNGIGGYSGDGSLATAASLDQPSAILVDDKGNIFIADAGNNCIRKISTNGIITTIAGNGTQGYSGDGGIATSATMYSPTGIATDLSGNLFIADNNNVIRKVDTKGIISTVAGNGKVGFSGDGG
jgi:hypothetical protein